MTRAFAMMAFKCRQRMVKEKHLIYIYMYFLEVFQEEETKEPREPAGMSRCTNENRSREPGSIVFSFGKHNKTKRKKKDDHKLRAWLEPGKRVRAHCNPVQVEKQKRRAGNLPRLFFGSFYFLFSLSLSLSRFSLFPSHVSFAFLVPLQSSFFPFF